MSKTYALKTDVFVFGQKHKICNYRKQHVLLLFFVDTGFDFRCGHVLVNEGETQFADRLKTRRFIVNGRGRLRPHERSLRSRIFVV